VGPFTKQVMKGNDPKRGRGQVCDTPTILKLNHSTPTCLWRWNRQSVPKRQHVKFRRRGITQKKTYKI